MEETKVPFMMDNIKKCICGRCPVQAKSECVREKMEMAKKMMNNPKMSDIMPKTADISGLYCSSGMAFCKDIDTKQMCVCGSCPVWEEYNLSKGRPLNYYCRDGRAV